MNKDNEQVKTLEGQPTQQQIKQAEDTAILKSEKGDKPYRKVYRPVGSVVTCYDCSVFQDLRLITTERESGFKKATHKKNRNRVAVLNQEGGKVYLCTRCIEKRAKGTK